MKRSSFVLVLAISLMAVACGKGGDSPTGPSATPRPWTQTVSGTVSSFGYTSHTVAVPQAGTMTIDLTWGTFADLDLYLTGPNCTGYPLSNCPLMARSDGSGTTTERITRTVSAGENFKAYVDSFSGSPQSYSITVTVR